ncbi:MAG: ParA family protein [Alphaproteobacteria bacterium]|nr:ParA family protein [Alphaproteobacteria bacterium]
MLTILVTNPKGGCGKSTLATNLAGAFALSGFQTVLADCDRQKSSLTWIKQRPDKYPPITGMDWTKKVGKVPDGTRRLVVDAPAAVRRTEVRDLVRSADVILIPVLPSLFDEQTTRKFLGVLDKLKPIRNNKRAVALVGNRIKARTTASRHLEEFLAGLNQDVVSLIRDTQLYPTAAAGGLSIFDMAPSRAERYAEEWRPLLRLISNAAFQRDR